MEWIKVSEKLPPVDERVLVCGPGYKDGWFSMGRYTEHPFGGRMVWDGEWHSPIELDSGHITHWMPTPALPEELTRATEDSAN